MTQKAEWFQKDHQKFVGYLDSDKKIKIIRGEHNLWKQYQSIKHAGIPYPTPCMMGRWHYHYTNDKKQHISLICTDRGRPGGRKVKDMSKEMRASIIGLGLASVNDDVLRGFHWQSRFWEICSGGTCPGCCDADELFLTRKEAEVRILELLK